MSICASDHQLLRVEMSVAENALLATECLFAFFGAFVAPRW